MIRAAFAGGIRRALAAMAKAASASPWEVRSERRPLVAIRVLMPPGCTVVTPMPSSSSSPAIDSEKPRRPNLFVQ